MMIHTGSAVRLGIFDEIKEMCSRLGIAFVSNGSVQSNPKIELIRELVFENIQDHKPERVDRLYADRQGGDGIFAGFRDAALRSPQKEMV
jgi:alcohol dehydrogenase YqhD (iron-dependent ADH family)